MDFIERLLGIDGRGDSITDIIRGISRWILGCGCIIVLLIIGGVVMLVSGMITLDSHAMSVILVVGTIIVAVASLIRTSIEGRGGYR